MSSLVKIELLISLIMKITILSIIKGQINVCKIKKSIWKYFEVLKMVELVLCRTKMLKEARANVKFH